MIKKGGEEICVEHVPLSLTFEGMQLFRLTDWLLSFSELFELKGGRAEEPANWLLVPMAVCLRVPVSASPPSPPFSLTLLARAAAANFAHSRGTQVLACLSALPADAGGSSWPSSLRCCALKNSCRLSARYLAILMSSDPKQGPLSNLSSPIASGRHLSTRNSLPLAARNKKETVYAVFYYMHKDFHIIGNISLEYFHLLPLTCLGTRFSFNMNKVLVFASYIFLL